MTLPVAIVGAGALLPGSPSLARFWHTLVTGRDLMTDVPPERWLVADHYDADPHAVDKTYGRRGAFLPAVDFDPLRYGIPPNNLSAIDASQLLSLLVTEQVLADCGNLPVDRERVSVLIGASALTRMVEASARLQRPTWLRALREQGIDAAVAEAACDRIAAQYVPWQEETFPGLLTNVVSGRIANRFGLHGVNHTTDAACASSLAALYAGVGELSLGRSDFVLTGGVDTMNDVTMFTCFSRTPALSPSGDCRPFAEAADGTMLGEGIVLFALKRLADAERDGDRVYAVVRGIGASSDGRGAAIYAPVPAGQARALRRAYAAAGYGPETVELVEAHGTGTSAGDAAEFAALREVFDASGRTDRQWCALGSVKSQIGHTKAAAGAAGLLKAVLALHHRVLPPTIKVGRPNPALDLGSSPFYLNTEARPWISATPRRASVSSFGFGGTNFHVTVEEHDGSSARRAPGAAPTELVLLSADSVGGLGDAASFTSRDIGGIARESYARFSVTGAARLALVVRDADDLTDALDGALRRISAGQPVPGYAAGPADPGSVGFLFPGQGSQYVGMGGDLAMVLPAARRAWDRAAALTLDVHSVVFPPPVFTDEDRAAREARLTATEWAQPALAVHSRALLDVLDAVGLAPDCVAGHSFGELVALHAAGAYDADALVRLARRRGELMGSVSSSASGAGMLAVAADRATVEALVAECSDVWLANHNGPRQVVVAGTDAGLSVLADRLAADRVSAVRLNVATAFHSPLVAAASGPLGAFLDGCDVRAPRLPVFGTAGGARYPADPSGVRERLAAQIAEPVAFVDVIEAMYASGVRTFVEVGPGTTLTGLVGRILGDRAHAAVGLDRPGRHGLTSLQEGLGRLAVHGVPLDPTALAAADDHAPAVPLSRSAVRLDGGNYGRPQPAGPASDAMPRVPEPQSAAAPPFSADLGNSGLETEPQISKIAEMPRPPDSPAPSAPPVAAPPRPVAAPARPVVAPGPVTRDLGDSGLENEPQVSKIGEMPRRPGSPGPAAIDDAWLRVIEDTQRQAAEAHIAFLRVMADSHQAYLGVAEATLTGLLAAATGQPVEPRPRAVAGSPTAVPELTAAPNPTPAPAMPHPAAAIQHEMPPAPPQPVPVPPQPGPVPPQAVPVPPQAAPTLYETAPMAHPPTAWPHDTAAMPHQVAPMQYGPAPVPLHTAAAPPHLAAAPPHTAAAPPHVAAAPPHTAAAPPHTGAAPPHNAAVPPNTSAMPHQAPVAPQPRPAAEPPLPDPVRTPPPAPERTNGAEPAAPPATADLGNSGLENEPQISKIAEDIEALLLEIVADRTGFPVEILNADMELDTELGIDSIKRVEILSAVRERLGDLPTADPASLTTLRTLREIAETLQGRPAEPEQSEQPQRPADPAPSEEDHTLPRAVLHAVEAPRSGLAIPGLTAGTIAVTDDGRGVAPLVVAGLRRRGIAAEAVARIRPDTENVILLDGLRPVADVTSATTAQRNAFRAARALAGRMTAHGGVFVTVQDTGGDFGLGTRQSARAWIGGLAALARTAAKEWPRAAVKAIDCATRGRSAADVADAIVAELFGGAGAPVVGLRADGTRIVPEPIAQSIEDTTARIGPDSVVVATGGARGVTAACLRLLAAKRQPKLVLLGRTPLSAEPPGLASATDEAGLIALLAAREPGSPSQLADRARRVLAVREIRDTLAAIERDGGTARYVSIDVRDAEALSWALDAVRRDWGPITALVHGAGVLADALIAETTNEQFGRVFDTKVQGLRALLAATADDPLEVLCAFSSVAAVFGNAGQAGYAMANEVLNQVLAAERARRPRCLVRSIAWGPWAGGMVTPTIAERFREAGVALIDPAAGAHAFLDEIDGPADGVIVVRAAENPLLDRGFTAEVTVTAGAHQYLADHRVNGVAVVPVATVLDWFAGAAAAWRPGAGPTVVRDLRVLDKIALPRLDDGGHRLVLRGHESTVEDGPALDLDLRDDAGRPHFRASVATAPPPGSQPWAAPPDLTPLDDPYDGTTLFHGPALRAVRGAPAVGAGGADGTVAGAAALAWSDLPSTVDIAAVDGALQLALLWARRAGAGDTLPMSVGECRVHRAGPVEGEIRCVVRGLRADDAGAVCDIALLEFDGRPVLELFDVHLVRRPGS